MKTQAQIAKHLRDVFYGGNWTWSNVRAHLEDVSWEQANARVGSLNTIVALTHHIHYYVKAQLSVMRGQELTASDKFSFDHPLIESDASWNEMLAAMFQDVDALAMLIDNLSDETLAADFADAKYGSYYRNLIGMIEHTHYHLGQIVVIKKLLEV